MEEPVDGFKDLDLLSLDRVNPVAIDTNSEEDFNGFLPKGVAPDGIGNIGA